MLADEKVMPEKKSLIPDYSAAESGIATAGEHVDKMSGCARRRSVYTTIATCRAHPAARRHCERLALFGNHANAETAVSALGETCLIWQPCEC